MEREELSWIEPQPEVVATTWNQNGNNNTNNNNNNNISAMNPSDPNTVFHLDSHLPSLKSMLEGDWYMNNNNLSDQNDAYHLDSSSCFLPPSESCFSPFSNDTTTTTTTISNPFHNNFESFTPFQATNSHVLMGFSAQMTTLNKSESAQLAVEQHVFGPSNAALIPNGPNVLRPLQSIPLVGAPPSLFQKRVTCSSGADDGLAPARFGEEGEVEGGLNNDYDDDHEVIEIFNSYNAKNSVNNKSNNNNHGNDDNDMADGEDQKGKKKGMPAKNVLIERRRRKKLNDSMFMLRSIVPKISKMDKASILRDAIDYLKELVKRINDLQLSSLGSSPCTSFHPVSVTPTLPTRVKKEICLNSTLSPKNQSPKVEVRVREGRNVSIHMFCAHRPGLFLSAMRALDGLGLDVQHAVISCFNGFSLDVFKAEQCKESQDVPPERIKTVLLDTAGFHGMI